MIVAGAKHACATCIRGHRSSSCTHADRPLFEIRKKGRPVSQCPHCRDLRKIKSCHTKCECGETPAEQSKTSKCRCHDGQPCSCAGPVQVYQYIPPKLSSGSSTSGSSSKTDDPKTPNSSIGSMLHTFQAAQSTSATKTANSIKMQNSMPYPPVEMHRHQDLKQMSTPLPGDSAFSSFPQPLEYHAAPMTPNLYHTQTPAYMLDYDHVSHQVAKLQPRVLPQSRRGFSSISKSTRSIGTNTDPLPAGIWPEDPFEVPAWANQPQSHASANAVAHQALEDASVTEFKCPKIKDMPLEEIPFARADLTNATNPVPLYSTFYHTQPPAGTGPAVQDGAFADGVMAIDHFPSSATADEGEDADFDPDYWDALFDVPGCSLPGVQCRCGPTCSCAGCQTHKDNADQVAFSHFERMDFKEGGKAPPEHPASCCDTRVLHQPSQPSSTAAPTSRPALGGCCGGGGGGGGDR